MKPSIAPKYCAKTQSKVTLTGFLKLLRKKNIHIILYVPQQNINDI